MANYCVLMIADRLLTMAIWLLPDCRARLAGSSVSDANIEGDEADEDPLATLMNDLRDA